MELMQLMRNTMAHHVNCALSRSRNEKSGRKVGFLTTAITTSSFKFGKTIPYLLNTALLFWHIVTLPPEAELQRSNIAMKTCCDEKIFQSHFSSEISMNWPSSNRLFRRARIKDSLLNVFDMPGFSSLHCCNGNSRNACI